MTRIKYCLLLLLVLLMTLPALSRAEETPSSPTETAPAESTEESTPELAPAPVPEPAEGAIPCEYTVPAEAEPYAWHLCDGDPFTTVTLRRNESITMNVPEGAKMLLLGLYNSGKNYELFLFDAEEHLIETNRGTSLPGYQYIPIGSDVKKAVLTCYTWPLSVADWYAVADENVLPFPDVEDEADVLVVLNAPGDELMKLGGVLPTLCGEHGLSARVVYFRAADGFYSFQCMQILRDMGIRKIPHFGTGRKQNADNDKATLAAMGFSGDQLRQFLVTEIRTCRPKLIITLDPEGESDYMDGFIARQLLAAVPYAEEPEYAPELEPFTPSKIYTIAKEGGTVVSGNTPLYAYDGITAAALADELYRIYREERVYRRTMPETVRFTLEMSTVGEDTESDDLLENLSADVLPAYRDLTPTPTPEPTEEPTPEPTETPTPEPTQKPTEAPTPEPTPERTQEPSGEDGSEAKPALWWLPAAIGAAAAVALWFLLAKRSKAKIPVCLLLLLTGIVLSFFMLTDRAKEPEKAAEAPVAETAAPTQEPTQKPTEESTTEPTPEPTEEPTHEPTPEPTPDPNDAYYLDGDGEEYELDFENGHWWYKNNVLAIDVNEVHTTFVDGNNKTVPLIYYVADIRMREYSSYRSGVRPHAQPWRYARLEKAVFAITGDNLDAEKEEKGCLIRKGVYYCNINHSDTLVIEDGMTLNVIPRREASERFLLDHGIRDTYGFGPMLVDNGTVSDYVRKSRVEHVNPRCGIGMIEPGHWIAIATEGRQPGWSHNISLEYFGQMFVDYGCKVAYNLDGGSSIGVVFMGEALNRHYMPGSLDLQRSWTDALLFGYSEKVPSPDIPTDHDGYRHDF